MPIACQNRRVADARNGGPWVVPCLPQESESANPFIRIHAHFLTR